jgi:hypothetical protein
LASFNKFNSFVEALAEKVHNLGSDTLTIALCAAANAPVATNTVLADLTQISYTNLSSRTLTVSSSAQTSGTYKLVIADKTLTASGGAVAAFRYVVIYNDTAANDELIGWYDYGTALTLADGESLTLDFDNTSGVLTLA